jgi:signal transduction histidine kinase
MRRPVSDLRRLRGERIDWLLTMLAGVLPVAAGDPVPLQQVLINFIMKGMDAMTATSSGQRLVTVATRRTPGVSAEVVVRDRGTGIAPAEQDRIFRSTRPSNAVWV